jgi:flagellar biosynthesis component FlhA
MGSDSINPKIRKVVDDIEKTKAKIAELQALLPELERKKIELENNEIVRLVRKAIVEPGDLAAFLENIKSEHAHN